MTKDDFTKIKQLLEAIMYLPTKENVNMLERQAKFLIQQLEIDNIEIQNKLYKVLIDAVDASGQVQNKYEKVNLVEQDLLYIETIIK